MNVCHVITDFGFGGAERLLVDLSALQVRDSEIHLVYLHGPSDLLGHLHPDVRVHQIPFSFSGALKLRRLLRQNNVDVVHTNLAKADLLTFLATFGLRVAVFCTMHNIWFKKNWIDRWLFFGYRLFQRFKIRKIQFVAISRAIESHLVSNLKVGKENVHLLYNSIAMPPHVSTEQSNELLNRLQISKDTQIILFIGRLVKQKSVHVLMDAVEKLGAVSGSYRVLIVGEGPLENDLRAMARELHITDQLIFAGVTDQPELYFSIADIFVLPSLFEGLPLTVLEAFAQRVPVVASNIEGPRELIQHEINGLFFEPGSAEDLARYLDKMLESPILLRSLADAARQRFDESFSMDIYVDNLHRLYQRAISSNDIAWFDMG